MRAPRNEAKHATNYSHYQTRATTLNYVFVIGQCTLYDTMATPSDVTDLAGVDYKDGRATTAQFTLRRSTQELPDVKERIQRPYTQLQHGRATLHGQRLVIEAAKTAPELATTPINEMCASKAPLRPGTVRCCLLEFDPEQNTTRSVTTTGWQIARRQTKAKEQPAQRWKDPREEE